MDTFEVIDVNPYPLPEGGGWQWSVDFHDDTRPQQFRTNGRGEGLWWWSEGDESWQQSRGAMQFALSGVRPEAIRQIEAYHRGAR